MHLKVHVFDKETLCCLAGVSESWSTQEITKILLHVGNTSPNDRVSLTTKPATSATVTWDSNTFHCFYKAFDSRIYGKITFIWLLLALWVTQHAGNPTSRTVGPALVLHSIPLNLFSIISLYPLPSLWISHFTSVFYNFLSSAVRISEVRPITMPLTIPL